MSEHSEEEQENCLQDLADHFKTQEDINLYLRTLKPKDPLFSVFCWLISYEILTLNSATGIMAKVTSVSKKYTNDITQLPNFNFSNNFSRAQEEKFEQELNYIQDNWQTQSSLNDVSAETFVKSAQTVIPFVCKYRGVEYRDGLLATYLRIYVNLLQIFRISVLTVHVEALSYFLLLEMDKMIKNLFKNASDDHSYVAKVTKLGQDLKIPLFDSPEKITKFTYSLLFDSFSKFSDEKFFELWDRIVLRKDILEVYLYKLVKMIVHDNSDENYLKDWASQCGCLKTLQFTDELEVNLYKQMQRDSHYTQNLVFASMTIAGLFILYRKFMMH